jgi:3-oxoacyl-[acyl-carrier-protein] synthase-1
VDQVLLLAADCVGPFVTHGFQSLQALTQERCRPFSPERSGLQLGEAAAAVLLSSQPQSQQDPRIKHVGVDAEGSAVTRSLSAGASLARACVGFTTPDLVIAHGTGTRINDPIEDKVLSSLFDPSEFWVTATKGCIGHTLGASGAIDLIAACEVLKNQRAFGITHFTSPDPEWNCRYLAAPESKPWSRIMMTSLGFGGIHAAAMIELESTPAPRSTA